MQSNYLYFKVNLEFGEYEWIGIRQWNKNLIESYQTNIVDINVFMTSFPIFTHLSLLRKTTWSSNINMTLLTDRQKFWSK